MPNNYDILITLGHRYQVMRTNDNTPVGASYATRKEAENYMRATEAEEYGYDWEPMMSPVEAVEKEVSARTVVSLGEKQKGLVPNAPGLADKSTKKRTTTAKELP